MTKENFHEKRAARRDRLERASERAAGEAQARFKAADQISERFYGGQPILVGHHSEKRARRDQERMQNAMRAGIEAKERAGELAARAAAVGTGGISSDDPNAIAELKAKLATREKKQADMRQANAFLRKGDDAGLTAMGYNPAAIASLKTPDYLGRIGFVDYEFKNNGAEIRRLKARIAELERAEARAAEAPARAVEAYGVRYLENAAANRLQIFFPAKPDAPTRALLKSWGFRWAPSEGAWQRHLNGAARNAAHFIREKLAEGAKPDAR